MPKTRTRAARPDLDDMMSALGHPLRRAILAELADTERSPKALTVALGDKLGNVSYHVRELVERGCLELVDTIPRRGAIEHVYRATVTVETRETKTGWTVEVQRRQ